jgi:hypothetical protein
VKSSELLDVFTGRQRYAQQVRQATVCRLQLADPLDKAAEASPRIRDGQGLTGSLGVLGDLLDERGGDKLLTVREPAVQRGDTDPGACGDLLQGSFQPLLGEHVPGGGEDRGPVALGVRPQPPRCPRGLGRGIRADLWAGTHSLMVGDAQAGPGKLPG